MLVKTSLLSLLIAPFLSFSLASAQPDAATDEPTVDSPSPTPVDPRQPTVRLPSGGISPEAGSLPPVGTILLEDTLTGPGAMPGSGSCPNGNRWEFVGEGLIFKTFGRCREGESTAGILASLPGVTVPDGEVRIDAKAVSGIERAQVSMLIRIDEENRWAYAAFLRPAEGSIALLRIGASGPPLAQRVNLGTLLSSDGWNSLAVRTLGPKFWVLLNDQLVLSAVDSTGDTGGVRIGGRRLGDPNDTVESAVVIRNLRISQLAP